MSRLPEHKRQAILRLLRAGVNSVEEISQKTGLSSMSVRAFKANQSRTVDERRKAALKAWIPRRPPDNKVGMVRNIYPDEVRLTNREKKLPEGATQQVVVNAYERNAEARKICLAKYGTECCICHLSFGVAYGERFQQFIHVHHLRPLHKIGRRSMVNPIRDLRPVCPNCHAVLHHGRRTYTIQQVKRFLGRGSRSKTTNS